MDKKVKLRSLFIGGGFTLLFAVLVVRIYWIQVVDGDMYLEKAQKLWVRESTIPALRGSILDRSDKVLAEDGPSATLALIPKDIAENGLQEEIVRRMAEILTPSNDPAAVIQLEEKIRSRITGERTMKPGQVEIRSEGWKIGAEQIDLINKFIKEQEEVLKERFGGKDKKGKVPSVGIILVPETSKRFYPAQQLAAHLLGYISKDGKPIMGLEKQLDASLKGTDGFLHYEKDSKGVELLDGEKRYQPAVNGNNVRLTLDRNIQFYMESALEKVAAKWNPKSMTAIAVDPMTMEILGLANYPTFNPNKYGESDQKNFINHAVASQYEPGSTFKIVTLAGAVQEGKFDPEASYQSGSIKILDRRLHDHNISGWGRITYLEGLKRSSNVAFVKLGIEALGQNTLKSYIERFGFGVKTDVDIPGEVPGIVNLNVPADYATATYGQGALTVNAMQLTSAYGAVANGGMLMKPYLIKEVYNPLTGEVLNKKNPEEVRRVITPEAAKQVTEYLETVVSDKKVGTGRNAAIEGYRIAGKTGTANKVLPGEKTYAEGKWVISFVGYAPAENPRILLTILVDEPDLGGDYHLGGEVAAPAFKQIVSQTLRYWGIAPTTQAKPADGSAQDPGTQVPNLIGKSPEEARAAMDSFGVVLETLGSGPKVLAQSPAPGTQIGGAQRMYVVLEEGTELEVPDLTGKSLRDAVEVCSFVKVRCQSIGEGYVASQIVEGSGESRTVTVTLKPYSELLETVETDKETKTTAKSEKSGAAVTSKTDTGKESSKQSGSKPSSSSGAAKKTTGEAAESTGKRTE
ncbi:MULTISPECIES: penicillin-binding transpeptidase domain-containing protein [Paenibacillus]|uniref:penicillin-binding transpeptidase domain-containing protein n=1 Tax=Paenibacillus TaxID=44249 RepID=UPI0022B90FF4|nr:penicillin-binding transpeptidase domain-containing protein [Paenibacillus caseinilyticus]MCZ8518769.1 penicillin-binding transpeptidase domain-containing protein [Paenibacillus caseinilyticus]